MTSTRLQARTDTDWSTFFTTLAGLLLGAGAIGGIIFVLLAVDGYVVYRLWNWFMPVIFGLRALRIPEALALTLVVLCILPTQIEPKEKADSYKWSVFIRPVWFLVLGYLVHRWYF